MPRSRHAYCSEPKPPSDSPEGLDGVGPESHDENGSGHISGLNRFQHASIPFMTVS